MIVESSNDRIPLHFVTPLRKRGSRKAAEKTGFLLSQK